MLDFIFIPLCAWLGVSVPVLLLLIILVILIFK